MSERLTRNDGGLICNVPCDTGEYCSCDIAKNAYIKLAHYEDLEEQGRLIELPCKVGDTVYRIRPCLVKCTDHKCWRMDDCYNNVRIMEEKFILNFYKEYGETVFLTRAEAETKMIELERKQCVKIL